MSGTIQYITPLLLAALVSAALAVTAWLRRPAPGALPFALVMAAVALWGAGYVFELTAASLPDKVMWARLEYIGIVTAPVCWFFFALDYTGHDAWLRRPGRVGLVLFPVLVLALVWTNDRHRLIWQTIRLDAAGPFTIMDVSYGLVFWLHTVYSYTMLLLATSLLVRQVLRSARLYRAQSGLLVIGVFAPWVSNVLYVLGATPAHLDLTPFAFTITGVTIGWSLLRSHLLDIVPVARDALVERMSDGVIVLNAQSRIVDINPAACAIIGQQSSRVIGQLAGEVFARRPDLLERYGDVHDTRAEIVLGPSDAIETYDLLITKITDRHGNPNGRLIVLRNITERKQAEQLLLQQNEYLVALHDTALGLVNRREVDNVLETIVARAGLLFGAPNGFLFVVDAAEQVLVAEVGTGRFASTRGMRVRRGECAAGRAWDTNQVLQVDDYQAWEGRLTELAGLHLGSMIVFPLCSEAGTLGVLGLAFNERGHHFGDTALRVLDRFGQLAALAIDNARLFDAVQVLYDEQRQLADQLRSAKDQAEAASLAKTEFISFVSHELRNPMTAMRGYIDLLKLGVAQPLNAEQTEIIDAVRLNIDMMNTLVADLIDVARIESGRLKLNCSAVAMHELIEAAAQAQHGQFEAKQLRFESRAAPDLLPAWADRVRVTQILANLLNNAYKYTPAGGRITVAAELQASVGAAPMLHVMVQDTGIGIGPEDQAQLFQHFFRSADPAAREAPGTGLGLTITRALVELQGGQIWLESTLHVGSTFHFTLPLASVALAAGTRPALAQLSL